MSSSGKSKKKKRKRKKKTKEDGKYGAESASSMPGASNNDKFNTLDADMLDSVLVEVGLGHLAPFPPE